MRGKVNRQQQLFYTLKVEQFVPPDHPLRALKPLVQQLLGNLRHRFNKAYSHTGRPSVPPEQILKALLLQALYSVRSEVLLVQLVNENIAWRWFLDLPLDAPVFAHDVFSDNRQRLADHGILQAFFDATVALILDKGLASTEHFSVDGTLVKAHCSVKSLRPVDDDTPGQRVSHGSSDGDPGNPTLDFRGQRRSNATHRSITDPEARLGRKGNGHEAMLCHQAHALIENRHGFVLAATTTPGFYGTAEREAALQMLDKVKERHDLVPQSLGGDKNYATGEFLCELERRGIEPHCADRGGKIDLHQADPAKAEQAMARMRLRLLAATGFGPYCTSERCRKKVEEVFGWAKTIGGLAATRFVGRWRVELQVLVVTTAYNLVRLATELGA